MKGYIIAGIISLVIIGGAGYYWFTLSKAPSYITASVKRGQIIEEVSARGNVASPTTINLQFQNSGKLTFFGVKVGDKVKAGDVIARQDTTVLKAQLRQAQALVDSQNAQLVSLEEGTRQEQIAVTEAQVKSDQIAVSQANQNIIYAIQSAYTVSDDSVHNKVDQIITNPKSTTPALVVTTNNSEAANKVLSERVSTENILTMWKSNVSNLSSSGSNLLTLGVEAQKNLSLISQFLSNVNLVLNGAVPTATESQTSINSWISNVATARTNVDSSVSSLNTAITTLKNNLATLDKDQKNLALEQAGSTKSSITAQEAQVAQAKANVSAIEAQIKQMELIAPVSGTITHINGNVGEVISPNVIAVSIIPTIKLQIDVNLSEENVGNVKIGNPVSINLNSFPSMKWTGIVAQIDPAQTIIGGAIYYKTKVVFNESDERIKSGMTANVLIQTGVATSTLIVPASALQANDIKTSVQLYQNEEVINKDVTTGLKSQEGMVEIISGLSEGENVVIGTQ